MSMDMTDKTVIITGGSRGHGPTPRRQARRRTAQVVVNYRRDDDAAKETVAEVEAAGGTAVAVQADIARHEAVESLVAADASSASVASTSSWPTPRPVPSSRSSQIHGRHVEKTMGLTVQGFLDLVRLSTPPHAAGRPGDGGLRVGQLPRASRPRPARRGEGGDGDDRQVPGHRARARRHHRRRCVPGPDRHRLVPLLRRRGVGRRTRSSGWRRRRPGAYPTPDEVADVMAYLVLAASQPPSTVRRSWSTADCRWRPCRSASARTDPWQTTAPTAETVVQLMSQVERRPGHDDRGRGEPAARAASDDRAARRGVEPAGQRLHRPGSHAR